VKSYHSLNSFTCPNSQASNQIHVDNHQSGLYPFASQASLLSISFFVHVPSTTLRRDGIFVLAIFGKCFIPKYCFIASSVSFFISAFGFLKFSKSSLSNFLSANASKMLISVPASVLVLAYALIPSFHFISITSTGIPTLSESIAILLNNSFTNHGFSDNALYNSSCVEPLPSNSATFLVIRFFRSGLLYFLITSAISFCPLVTSLS
jgi:hypothetical protein